MNVCRLRSVPFSLPEALRHPPTWRRSTSPGLQRKHTERSAPLKPVNATSTGPHSHTPSFLSRHALPFLRIEGRVLCISEWKAEAHDRRYEDRARAPSGRRTPTVCDSAAPMSICPGSIHTSRPRPAWTGYESPLQSGGGSPSRETL